MRVGQKTRTACKGRSQGKAVINNSVYVTLITYGGYERTATGMYREEG
jgi:hypothetical protein